MFVSGGLGLSLVNTRHGRPDSTDQSVCWCVGDEDRAHRPSVLGSGCTYSAFPLYWFFLESTPSRRFKRRSLSLEAFLPFLFFFSLVAGRGQSPSWSGNRTAYSAPGKEG